jgi:5-methylcytosine-specific restriction endonuclease McrA
MDVLLLNSNAQPLNLLPVSIIHWQDAIKYIFLDKVTVLSWYDNWIVRSENWETKVPAVIMLTEYMKQKTTVRFSKQNVFLRDLYTCQYCGTRVNKKSATLDHVLPVSLGGHTVFENSTTACHTCNSNKGNNSKIKPKKTPHRPGYWELIEKRKKLPFDIRHPDWEMFLTNQ